MIEIICNGEDDSNKGNMRGNADIRRPKNIKQKNIYRRLRFYIY